MSIRPQERTRAAFTPMALLMEGVAHPACCACVILPARNEEGTLVAALAALASQVDLEGRPLPPESFEVVLLLNNCTDGTAALARRWKAAHPMVTLHIIEYTIPEEIAHVGTARRLLMDTAWHRLGARPSSVKGILSTDADTEVALDWIAQNVCALERGADAVGGVINLRRADLDALPGGVRQAYLRDRRYQRLVAELESLLDPQAGDPWPRHLEHFGASLACTPQAYARAGGMPAIKPLEDVAFIDALRRIDARLRHEPAVKVYTSSRFEGRVEVGLSHQLGLWKRMSEAGEEQRVASAARLTHRFTMLRELRRISQLPRAPKLASYPAAWRERIADAHHRCSSTGQFRVAQFLGEIDCDRLIEETFVGSAEGEIRQVMANLSRAILKARLQHAPLVNARANLQSTERVLPG